jgi:hypothetical protein
MLLVSYAEEKLIRQIILGCENFVCNMEDKRYNRKFRPRKPSLRKLVQLSVLYPSLTDPYNSNGFRSFPKVNSKLENEKVDPSLVNRSLKTLVNVNYYEKTILDKRSKFSGVNTNYHESGYLFAVKELVSKPIPRAIIYYKLLESNILSRYLTILNYSELLMCKHIDFDRILLARKGRGLIDLQDNIDKFKERYNEDQKSLQHKTNKEILFYAEILAKKQIQSKQLDDSVYTTFFIAGGISYGEIEHLPYEK